MIQNLRAQNFRSYSDKSFKFSPGVNIIAGPNGSGKTNLLEAVMVLARGTSFRSKDADLIKHGACWSRLDGLFDSVERSLKLQIQNELLAKSFVLESKDYKRLSAERTTPVVYFEPNHLSLITRGPNERCQLIDEILEDSTPAYKKLSSAYRRTLAQRNALLKRGPSVASQQLFAWDVRLGELASQIVARRLALAGRFNSQISQTYSQIAKKPTKAEIKYKAQFSAPSYASQMVARLSGTVEQDLLRGFTGTGPHREDFVFKIDGQPISTAASRGEVRSLFLALKILELELIAEVRGQKPICLLDDVFSELDATRRKALVKSLSGYQSIITTTDADAVVGYVKKQDYKIIKTKN